MPFYLVKISYFRTRTKNGTVAEWLGRGLQNLLQQFESARYLSYPAWRDFFMDMLTGEEKKFIQYWAANRLKKKRSIWQFSFGLPLGVLIVLGIFINLVSGWYKQADMLIRSNSSVIIVILIAAIAIVVFMSIFSARHQWEQNEQHYQELLAKEEKLANNNPANNR